MGETLNQRVKCDAGSRQEKCVLAQLTCRDLIGQPECGLEASIGWEPRARSHAHTNGLSKTFNYEVTDACGL